MVLLSTHMVVLLLSHAHAIAGYALFTQASSRYARPRLTHTWMTDSPDNPVTSTEGALGRAWLNSLKSDARESDLAARLNNRSRYYDPALRYVYDNLSSSQKQQLYAISKAPRPQRAARSRRRRPSFTSKQRQQETASTAPLPSEQPTVPRTYAVLVDAENANWRTMESIMAQVGRYGDARIRRMYGDFSVAQLAPWAEVERNHSFMMVHQGALVKGKGCSNILLAADAMEIRYENDVVDGFCIVSSDSDFAPLVKRLREAGKHVVGFGRAATPKPFQTSCNVFVATEGLDQQPAQASTPLPPAVAYRTPQETVAPETEKMLFDIINAAAIESDGGWTRLATVERLLLAEVNQFDPRRYGAASLGELLNSSRCSVLDGEHRRAEFEVGRD